MVISVLWYADCTDDRTAPSQLLYGPSGQGQGAPPAQRGGPASAGVPAEARSRAQGYGVRDGAHA